MHHLRRALSFGPRALALGSSLLACACAERPPLTPVDPGPPEPVVEHVAEQQILTPLPMRVRLPARYGAERVLTFVHLWGTRGWRTLELARSGQTWEGEVSCRAVSTVTGDTQYFFVALDAHGEPVVGSGSPEWPHVATIVRELAEGPRGLPGEGPPMMCHDPADCPADLPGCPAYAAVRPTCEADADCGGPGRCAWDGYCEGPAETEIAAGDEQLETAVRKAIKWVKTAKAGEPARQ